jgi:hypothetical protein
MLGAMTCGVTVTPTTCPAPAATGSSMASPGATIDTRDRVISSSISITVPAMAKPAADYGP